MNLSDMSTKDKQIKGKAGFVYPLTTYAIRRRPTDLLFHPYYYSYRIL